MPNARSVWLDVKRDVVIDAPREQVWQYLADFRRHTEWSQPEHELRIEPPTELRAGATFTSIGKELGREWRNTVTITALVPGERLEFVASHDTTAWRNLFEPSDAGDGTRVTKGEKFVSARFPMIVLVAVLMPWLWWETGRVFTADLARIKARLELRASTVASQLNAG
jgi:uncharacterized protein YndB with AHSA1/START domain